MEIISDFSIEYDNDVDVSLYDNNFDEDDIKGFLEKVIYDKLITVGERCEGSISVDHDTINIEYRWCSDLGENWNDDIWVDEEIHIPRKEYDI